MTPWAVPLQDTATEQPKHISVISYLVLFLLFVFVLVVVRFRVCLLALDGSFVYSCVLSLVSYRFLAGFVVRWHEARQHQKPKRRETNGPLGAPTTKGCSGEKGFNAARSLPPRIVIVMVCCIIVCLMRCLCSMIAISRSSLRAVMCHDCYCLLLFICVHASALVLIDLRVVIGLLF